jgi:hypothetical protein
MEVSDRPFIVMTVGTVKLTRKHAAFLETTSWSHTGTGRFDRASRINSLSPWTTRGPRLTRCSDGKPRRRLLVRSKALFGLGVSGFHDTSPYARNGRAGF